MSAGIATASGVAEILTRTLEGERLSDENALALLRSRELLAVGRAANEVRNHKTDPGRVTFVVDRNVNYTNICSVRCEFCAFSCDPGDLRQGYLLPRPVLFKKIEETLALGGTGVLMQGGHHPDLDFAYYDDLFRSIKARYEIHLHALSPSEILHISRRSKLTVPETIRRLHEAGLDSIPGGGAEILVDRVRRSLSPRKYGHIETLAERVEHMRRIRELQDETGGFRAFISWTFQRDGNRLQDKVAEETRPTPFDYLLTQAVSRLYLDNVPHIQASWLTQGLKIGQLALAFGADDIGSTMIEENVVASAGTHFTTTTEELVHLIRAFGKRPVQRDTYYNQVRAWE